MKNPFLVGELYYLRKLEFEDIGERYLKWMHDPQVTQFLAPTKEPHTLDSLRAYWQASQKENVHFLAIVDKENDNYIGNVKFDIYDQETKSVELAMLVGEKEYWGKSCMVDVYNVLIDYAFNKLNLNRVTLGAEEGHIASVITFKKLGFKFYKKDENFYEKEGKPIAFLRYELTEERYRELIKK